ncbi:MAG TPA: RidA family protein [Acidobacteriota bacterium]|nr:RidA family protein [Acidobacteriota bacterium]
MSTMLSIREELLAGFGELSEGERSELVALGMLAPNGSLRPFRPPQKREGLESVPKQQMSAPDALNEAYEYGSAFSRGVRVDLGPYSLLFISGTASVDEDGETVHAGDLRAQCWRTFRNITELLAAEGASWKDVLKTTCYLRDIERDYEEFNRVRTAFYDLMGLQPYPASVGIQARLCRSNLLVEIEALAIVKNKE